MKQIFFVFTALVILISCKHQNNSDTSVQSLNSGRQEATAPYFTQDNRGNPVLCFSEIDTADSLYRLKYTTYNSTADAFGPAVLVPGSKGLNIAAESMGKVAFKGDGTAVAVFGRRFEREKSPFAGAIYFMSSADKGKTWTRPEFLHSDTAHAYGRGFFDLARLRDGQLAAVWLDGRFGKSIQGSALFFATTAGTSGFGADKCLEKGTCECCRTDLLTDAAGNLHLAYRSILFPDQLMGKQVRDMVYKVSNDNGKTFSSVETISKDNWRIEGCPHSGPSLAVQNNGVTAVWFTGAGAPGIYTAATGADGKFRSRNLLSSSGRHPQMSVLPGGKMAVVSEEVAETEPQKPAKMDHSAAGMQMNHAPAVASKIVVKVLQPGGGPVKTLEITDGQRSDHHAVVAVLKDALLIAWVRTEKGHSSIFYSKVDLQDSRL
jgi:hypothetical protein